MIISGARAETTRDRVDLENVVVVGVDGSEHSNAAAQWAAEAAQRRGAELRLVCAWMLPIETMSGMDVPPLDFADSQRRWAEGVVQEAAARVAHRHPGLRTSTVVSRDFPLIALRRYSEHGLMTVVGAQGSGAVVGLLMGSPAQELVAHGPGAVVVVRHRPSDQPSDRPAAGAAGPVVVGLDGSPGSDGALAFAFEEASFRQVALFAVRVWDGGEDETILLPHLTAGAAMEEASSQERALAEQLTGWSEKYPDVEVHRQVLRGRPAPALLTFCASRTRPPVAPTLLVVGSRGRGGLVGLVLGSTSQALAAHSENPVCVVHRTRP